MEWEWLICGDISCRAAPRMTSYSRRFVADLRDLDRGMNSVRDQRRVSSRITIIHSPPSLPGGYEKN